MMTREEIQTLLAEPDDLFYDQQTDPATVFLTYRADQEEDLRKTSKSLKHILDNADNYIEINVVDGKTKYQVIIASPSKGSMISFEVPVLKGDYNELLLTKSHEDKVKLGFYIAQKEVQRTPAEIAAMKADKNYDEDGVIKAEEPYYIPVKIEVENCLFKIKSDGVYQEESAFVDLKPEVALAHAAQLHEEKRKKDDSNQ